MLQTVSLEPDLLKMRNVGCRFARKTIWIEKVDLPRGKLIAIVGSSGSGKSTLLHLIGGLCAPNYSQDAKGEPSIRVAFGSDDRPVRFELCNGVHPDFRRRLAFVFQSSHLLQSVPASTNIALGALSAGRSISQQTIQHIARDLEIDPSFLSDRSNVRSGGERQRIALGRAFARSPGLILADEPTASLDPRLAEETIRLIRDWTRGTADRTAIWVTHDVRLASAYADCVVVLQNGQIASGTDWPKPTPRDPSVLRDWIDGAADAYASGADSKSTMEPHRSTVRDDANGFRGAPLSIVKRFLFWCKIGTAQVFDGPGADESLKLRQWTSHVSASRRRLHPRSGMLAILDIIGCYGAKSAAVRLGCFLAVLVLMWAAFDNLARALEDFLRNPTVNPVVISSKAVIDNAAVSEAQKLLTGDLPKERYIPNMYGRYEFGQRRVSIPRAQTDADCAKRQGRGDEEIQLGVAAVDPSEPFLRELRLGRHGDTNSDRGEIADRTDGLWTIWMSQDSLQKLSGRLGTLAKNGFVCMEVGGVWLTAQVTAVATDYARGRRGPYDIIMSATQWHDFGPPIDRNLYESVAVYFDVNPTKSQALVELVRERAREISGPPNTSLVQSLANEAAFERISAALERNLLSNVILGLFSAASIIVLALFIYGYISDSFRANLKAICVSIAFGASLTDILILQMMRLILVLVPSVAIAALAMAPLDLLSQAMFRRVNLWEHFGSAVLLFVGSAMLLAVAISAYWVCHIRRRSLADQLKELD
jgi:ABC-type lipoprotein export system ATPase subunit